MAATTTTEGADLVISRRFAATPGAIWPALTDAETPNR